MNKRVTMKHIAEVAGVSVSAVSRVLSDQATKYRISKKSQVAVHAAAKKLNFSPNALARGLRLRKTWTLGLVLPDISNHFFSDIARVISIDAREKGYSLMLCDSEDNTDVEAKSLKLLQDRQTDGLIILPVGHSWQDVATVREAGTPVVMVDRVYPELDVPCVSSDNFRGAYDATMYLLSRGHRRIAFIQGIPEAWTSITRRQGYEAALCEYGLEPPNGRTLGREFTEKSGYLAAKKLLRNKERPTAIFAAGNLITFGVLRATTEEHMTIPDNISIISFDELPYYPHLATPVTTVSQQKTKMGQAAVQLLLRQVEGETLSSTDSIVLPTKLIEGDSVRSLSEEPESTEFSGPETAGTRTNDPIGRQQDLAGAPGAQKSS